MKIDLKKALKNIWRRPLKKRFAQRLNNRNFVLISSNCIGGCLLHDVGEEFNTPTINLVIDNFVPFCERLMYYLQLSPVVGNTDTYPIAYLEDISIQAIHYKSAQEFLDAWTRRTIRLFDKIKNGAEIVIMAADTQLQEIDAKERFLALPYRKVCFTSKREWTNDNDVFVYIPEFEGEEHVGDLTKYAGISGVRIFEKYFDCISFLNNVNLNDK